MRRAVSVLLLFCFTVSSAEAVAGLVRTGDVHAEAVAEATPATDPGRAPVRADPARSHQHSDDHRHDERGDHCVHFHPPALPAGAAVIAVGGPETDRGSRPAPEPPEAPPLPILPQPPKA